MALFKNLITNAARTASLLLALLGASPMAHAGYGDPGTYSVIQESYGSWTGGANTTTDIRSYFDSPASHVTDVLGITMDKAPLRATVFRPSATGKFPIVFILHGNHAPEEASFQGYAYLQQHLASQGYIAVAIDEDFLNGAVGEMDARAIVLLRHMQLWRKWSTTFGNQYYNKVDMTKIALVGHSRGGEAIAVAKVLNTTHSSSLTTSPDYYKFNIAALFSIAPTDKYILMEIDPKTQKPYFANAANPDDPSQSTPIVLDDAAYATLQGSRDEDVGFFYGQNQYERAQRATLATPTHIKAAYMVNGANHKHFNSVWAAPCVAGYTSEACADGYFHVRPLAGLIRPDQSQQALKVYLTAYLENVLRTVDTTNVLTNRTPDASLPAGVTIVPRYQSKGRVLLNHYQEDTSASTGSRSGVTNAGSNLFEMQEMYLFPNEVWFFGIPMAYQDYPHSYLATNALRLAWQNSTAEYRLNFATTTTVGSLVSSNPVLSFDAGQMYEFTQDKNPKGVDQDFTVHLLVNYLGTTYTSNTLAVSNYARLPYPDRAYQVAGEDNLGSDFSHSMLRTVRIPLADFVAGKPTLALSQIKGIVFKFNQKPTGRVLLDNIQVTK
ncbi:hypothetical protein [Janthinobacterium sp. 17J80-10]|uniref:poly(ethylene terephthalate) hydrolase family protein n=1 Tax=Janthinobacterium sp. 17J80-10 TaxID=2497863 RepID=UPI00100533ED|nr:hypothetical protein [Janthinobacterium sp. 17J80-10]QAU32995.1 hypothetical protein EKL02_01740 [Janthinobacterium sp. 17J80-10]